MRAGKLRKRIEIQENRGTAQDSFGAPSDGWVTLWRCYAEVLPISGNEQLINGEHLASVSHVVRTRYFAGPTSEHRIKWGSRYLHITSAINKDERGREALFACSERK
jgi:SPP1 family predicted phage head-tail adaptor